jgi:hypothetical protein
VKRTKTGSFFYVGDNANTPYNITIGADSNIFVSGYAYDAYASYMRIAKLDTTFNLIWQMDFISTATKTINASEMCKTKDNAFAVVGYTNYNYNVSTTGDMMLVKVLNNTCAIPEAPTITSSLTSGFCPNNTAVKLKITAGNKKGGTLWSWYNEGSCQSLVGTGDSITVYPNSTTNRIFFAKATGGCTVYAPYSYIAFNDLLTAPTVKAGSDVSVCNGNSVTLKGSGNAKSYTWDNGITNNKAFTPTKTKTYTVTGTATNGCTATDDVVVTVTTCTGVDEAGEDKNICLYPNPSSQLVSIKGIDTNVNIDIYNVSGSKVLHLSDVKASNPVNIDFLPSGLYFIQIDIPGENKTIEKNFIKK